MSQASASAGALAGIVLPLFGSHDPARVSRAIKIEYLPLDAKSANFDNIADAQLLSPTLMQAYLTAAAEVSRLAVGDRAATAREATYPVSRWTSQREHVEGAPYGTRGGTSVVHGWMD